MKQTLSPPQFSIAEARRIVKDLFEPRPAIYWTDFLLTMLVGYAAFGAVRRLGLPPWAIVACFAVSCLAFYRAALFTHELTHLRRGTFAGFRLAWNLLCGIPFLMPSFTYHAHVAHHARRHFGTADDGEYVPWGASPVRRIVAYLAQTFVIPVLAVVRFLVLTPLAWTSPVMRRWVSQRASSLVVDPSFVRPLPTRGEVWVWRLQEVACFAYLAAIVPLLAAGRIPRPIEWIVQAYLTAVCVVGLNAVRTLVAHRYRNTGEEMTFVEQLLDSVNYPNKPALAGLWAPVGLRFHALHHLFPSLPYHNLAEAHRRLMASLPADSPYRQTNSAGLRAAMAELWRNARASTARQAEPAVR